MSSSLTFAGEFALGPSLGLGVEITETVTHCGPGYHLAGRKCAPDTKCSNSTCNGHGLCDDSSTLPRMFKNVSLSLSLSLSVSVSVSVCVRRTRATVQNMRILFCTKMMLTSFCSSDGYPKCLCFPGFITVGDNFCSACENLHQTYPKCTQDENKKDEFEMYVVPFSTPSSC